MEWIRSASVIYSDSFEPFSGFWISLQFKRINLVSCVYRPAVHSKLNSIEDHRIYLMTMNVGSRGYSRSIHIQDERKWDHYMWTIHSFLNVWYCIHGSPFVALFLAYSLRSFHPHSLKRYHALCIVCYTRCPDV